MNFILFQIQIIDLFLNQGGALYRCCHLMDAESYSKQYAEFLKGKISQSFDVPEENWLSFN